jgi:uncharacterized protein involved in cysteine biosynthesis
MIQVLNETIPFIVEQKLWKGFFKQRTVLYLTIFLGIAVPITFFNYFDSRLTSKTDGSETARMGLSSLNLGDTLSIFSGYHKYIILILFAMLITYFMYKTLDAISGFEGKITIRDYIDSQIRYIIVTIRNWAYELVLTILISIVIGIFGPDWAKPILKFLVGSFFLGYLFLDGYYHIFEVKIKEANKLIQKHRSAALILGIVVKLLFAIPYIGAVIGSIVGAVSAAWYMHTSEDKKMVNTLV